MKLTGKAKEDFIKYYKFGKFHFENVLDEKYQYAEIIEWFDSVGIYIEIVKENFGFGFNIHRGNWKNPDESVGYWIARQDATEKAIEKENEIYNNVKVLLKCTYVKNNYYL